MPWAGHSGCWLGKHQRCRKEENRGWYGAGTTQRTATPNMAAGQQKRSRHVTSARQEPGRKQDSVLQCAINMPYNGPQCYRPCVTMSHRHWWTPFSLTASARTCRETANKRWSNVYSQGTDYTNNNQYTYSVQSNERVHETRASANYSKYVHGTT